MPPRTRHALRVASLLVASVVGEPSGVLAQRANQQVQRDTRLWYEAYDEGMSAIRGQQWQAAVNSLLAAKNLRAQQGRRVAFYGDRAEAYIPDYYLGVAYLALGRFAEADAAFDRVTQGKLVVQGDGPFAQFQRQATQAKAEAAVDRAIQAAKEGFLNRAEAEMAAAQKLGAPTARLAEAQNALEGYQSAMGAPRDGPLTPAGGGVAPSQAANPPAPAANPPAAGGVPPASAGKAPDESPAPITSPTPVPAGTPTPATVPPLAPASAAINVPNLLGLPEAAARTSLQASGLRPGRTTRSSFRNGSVGSVIRQIPTGGTRVLPGTIVDLVVYAPAAPAVIDTVSRVTEVDGVRAFLAGDYATAAQTLETVVTRPATATDGPTARGRLYLATSLAALVLVGDRERTTLDAARQQLALAGALDRFAADRRLISPRIWSALGVTAP